MTGLSFQTPSIDAIGDLAIEVTALESHPVLLSGGARDLYVYVSLHVPERIDLPRPALNLALVVERSGSMASECKLQHARAAAEQLVQRLRPEDRLALVVYDGHVETLVPSLPASEQTLFLDALARLEPGGSTDLHGGLLAGYEEVLQRFDGERVNKVVLLSDGLPKAGLQDREAIRARAAACRARGVRISTFGMGLDYDEVLLSGIAAGAGGIYAYVDHPESVGAHLDRELDQMAHTLARDLELRLDLGPGVVPAEVHVHASRLAPGRDGTGSALLVPLNDMASGERRKSSCACASRVRRERNAASRDLSRATWTPVATRLSASLWPSSGRASPRTLGWSRAPGGSTCWPRWRSSRTPRPC